MPRFTVKQFHAKYPNDDACLNELWENRYGALKSCPFCLQESKFYRAAGKKHWDCARCGAHLSPLADTIFHKSSTPLKDWFFAIYLFANSKNGVSAKELERHLGVTYKTAWRMAKQIRQLFASAGEPLGGTVEADETYVGGIRPGKRGRGAAGKTPVIGVVERGGRIHASVIANTKASTVIPFVWNAVKPGATIMTDENAAYNRLPKLLHGFTHKTITHSSGQYVNGDVHTNTIEGFWSQLKRGINGTYHAVSLKYLQSYVDEFAYRYSHRHSEEHLFHKLIPMAAKRVV
jgi:transposase